MTKVLLVCFFFIQAAYCVNYSEMSTQELLAIMGYVKPENQSKFLQELESRKKSMTTQQKEIYNKNKQKIDKKEK